MASNCAQPVGVDDEGGLGLGGSVRVLLAGAYTRPLLSSTVALSMEQGVREGVV